MPNAAIPISTDPVADYAGDALDRLNRVRAVLARSFGDGFAPIEPAILQSAEFLFDLYGEEIWERAFVLDDSGVGALCLRPDFTVPVARAHLAGRGVSAARYAYAGPVFRRPAKIGDAPLQHLQTGVEIIGEADAVAGDVEVYTLSLRALDACGCEGVRVLTGDLAIPFALLDALSMPANWRRRLKRHFWRPDRFQRILADFASDEPASGARRGFLKDLSGLAGAEALAAADAAIAANGAPHIGARARREIAERALKLAADAGERPLSGEIVALIEAALAVKAPSDAALAALRDLFGGAGVDLEPQLAALERRLESFAELGVAPDTLPFDAAFGRNLAYYDGFVFELLAGRDGARVKLGGGGRYNRLFWAMGERGGLTGVGAALRPEAVLSAQEAET